MRLFIYLFGGGANNRKRKEVERQRGMVNGENVDNFDRNSSFSLSMWEIEIVVMI
jgi:hypothetical protein